MFLVHSDIKENIDHCLYFSGTIESRVGQYGDYYLFSVPKSLNVDLNNVSSA